MKIIKTGESARSALKRGIDLACDAIKITLGPNGRNAVLGRIDIPPIITNDGVSVARNIEAEDEIENQGVWIVKEACSVTSNKVKDGTTRTAVLLQAIVGKLFDGLKDNGVIGAKKPNVIELMKEVDEACIEVCKYLKDSSRPIKEEEIYNVAKAAGEFEWLAEIVTEIFKKVGKDGYVDTKEGLKTYYETFKGIELGVGYQSEYFSDENGECVLEEPLVFVTNQSLDDFIINPVTSLVEQGKKNIIIIAPEFSRSVFNRFNTTKLKTQEIDGKGVSIVALKLPTFDKDDLLVDIATLTKAKFLDKNTYVKVEDFIADFNLSSGGSVERAIIADSKSIMVGGEGDCTARVEALRGELSFTQSAFDRDNLEKRIAYLSGGIATLTIGGESDFEKTYFKLKAENAVNSVQQALKGGVVKGGGLSMVEASDNMPENILTSCITAPYKQIQANAGGKLDIPDTIIDAVDTEISSLQSACSLAGRVLTTEVVIAFKNEKENK